MPLTPPWSSANVVGRLLRAARSPRDRALIVGYFAARRGARVGPVPAVDRPIGLRDLPRGLAVDPGSGGLATYYEIVLRRIYSPGPEWVPAPGDTVVDVGANIGVYSLWASGLIGAAGTLVAVEPNPETYALLDRNAADATIHRVAAGAGPGSAEFHYVPGRLSVGSFHTRADRTASLEVPIEALDDLLAGLGAIDLLKVDVEGFEHEVLAGAAAVLSRTRRVALEIAGDDLAAARATLEDHGFAFAGKIAGMWGISEANGVIAWFERPGAAR